MTDYKKALLLDKIVAAVQPEVKVPYSEGSNESAKHDLETFNEIVVMLRKAGAIKT